MHARQLQAALDQLLLIADTEQRYFRPEMSAKPSELVDLARRLGDEMWEVHEKDIAERLPDVFADIEWEKLKRRDDDDPQ